MLPGRKSVFRAGFRSDSNRDGLKIGPPAGLSRPDSGRNPARKTPVLLQAKKRKNEALTNLELERERSLLTGLSDPKTISIRFTNRPTNNSQLLS